MAPFRWLSLLVASVSFALIFAMLTLLLGPAWQLAGGSRFDAALAAALIGILTGGMIWLVGGAYDAALRQATVEAHALANGDEPEPRAHGFGLEAVVEPLRHLQQHTRDDRRAADQRCRKLEAELARLRNESFAGVSHELRTPLSSIRGCLEMLLDGEASDLHTRSEFYNIILTETNRLSGLIDNVVNISEAEAGNPAARETVDLAELINDIVTAMLPQARARRITLNGEAPSPAIVHVEVDMIGRAARQLIGNALKYTQPGGRIDVRLITDKSDGTVRFVVADTGVGIPPEALPHVFDKFYRVANHTRMAKGTGLGLNLVRHAVETVHNGTIGVTSEVGSGSTFTLTLPLADNHMGAAAEMTESDSMAAASIGNE